jgi:isopenicillin N synthase-like dioxygenase
VIELFCYHLRKSAEDSSSSSKSPPRLPCSVHTDASLLTIVPRCVGPPGLEILNWRAGAWQAVEAQSGSPNECIVFAGDMLPRLLNGAILAAQHRVNLPPVTTDQVRLSTPMELFPDPRLLLDCAKTLAHSWPHLTEKTLTVACTPIETAQMASCAFSQGLVSVNKSS